MTHAKGFSSALLIGLLMASARVAAQPDPADPANSDIPADTPMGSGPYRAIMEMDRTLPTHTLYRPADLSKAGKLPVVLWGNGACWNAGNAFRWFLSDIASYGYFVIALGPIVKQQLRMEQQSMIPVAPTGPPDLARAKLPPPQTHSGQLIEALNWAIAENERSGSRLRGHLNTAAVAVMGQSCGGAQALEVSADPRIVTTVIWNSGLFREPTAMGGGRALTREDLKQLHAPTAIISGDEEDIAFVNAEENFELIKRIPVFRAYARGVLHSGTYGQRYGGEFAGVAVGWLNWQLKHDARAAKMFVGRDCGLCVNPHWVVRTKNMP